MTQSDQQEIIDTLANPALAVEPQRLLNNLAWAKRSGMDVWWADDEARVALGELVSLLLESLLYVGQAGAPNGPRAVGRSLN